MNREKQLEQAKELLHKFKKDKKKGLSIRAIAKKHKVSTGRVYNYLNGKLPKPVVKRKRKKKSLTKEQKLKNRSRQYFYRYGITLKDYFKMYKEQKGECPICLTSKPISGNDKMVVDHCHETNRVRGLLCHSCNTNLGKFKDSIEVLQRAIDYLSVHSE